MDDSPRVALAGASGFVGSRLRADLGDRYQWVGLTRSQTRASATDENTTWRHCDLFSLPQVEEALQGCHKAIYLVHSMLPSSRLLQANFEDLDLLLADNFIRACEGAGIRELIFLGGLMPQDTPAEDYSPHLRSRLEVERVLQSRSVAVTVLRAGLILGPGGSSTRMLVNLTRRLPLMVLPAWTRNQSQSIDVRDVVRAVDLCLQDAVPPAVYDIAGHPPMSYREMILTTAQAAGRRILTLNMPANFFRLSGPWVSLISGVSPNLVNPLLDSLRHNLQARPNPLLHLLEPAAIPFRESVHAAMAPGGTPVANPRSSFLRRDRSLLRKARRVRSVQRMPLPAGMDAGDIAALYAHWLEQSLRIVKVRTDSDGGMVFRIGNRLKLLKLTPTPYSAGMTRRRAFYINGGLLALKVDPPGRFEFRIFPENHCLIAAIHGYAPRLPWPVYAQTQARVHLAVMRAFSRYLARRTDDHPGRGNTR